MDQKDMKNIQVAASTLKLMSHKDRLAILCYIGEQELSVNELVALIGISQSALSQHLTKLKAANLVSQRRDHNKIFYALASKEVSVLIETMRKLYCE